MVAEGRGRAIAGREEERRKERSVIQHSMRRLSDLLQVCVTVLLTLNTELNSRDSFNRNLIVRAAEWQRTRTHTQSRRRSQHYEIALFDVACNLRHIESKLYRLRVQAWQKRGKKEERWRRKRQRAQKRQEERR